MKKSINVSDMLGGTINTVPPGSPDFRKLSREEMGTCLMIGKRAYEMARVAKTSPEVASRLSSIQLSSMIVASVHLQVRLDLNRFLLADPFTFWDEIQTITEKIVSAPVVFLPRHVKLRFALPK